MNMTITKKRMTGMLALVLVAALAVTSLALFTDRAQSQAEVTAGTLDLSLAQTWADDNKEVIDEYAPGDILNLDYTITNNGNLSTDICETFVITSDKPISNEFEIYAASDVEKDAATGLYAAKASKNPIEVRSTGSFVKDSITYYTITYKIPEFTVNGTGEGAETEDGITSNSKTGDYVLLFHKDSENSIQGTNLTVEYMAQGLQHRNTGDTTWTDAKVITEKFTIGGAETSVVPQLNDN